MIRSKRLLRLIGAGLGTIAAITKAAEAKEAKVAPRHRDKEERTPQLREADVLGQFRLGYVDCIAYSGPEQLIFIEPDGAIECFQEDAVPGLVDRENRTFKRRELGRLRTGSLLKGELSPAKDFQSSANDHRAVSSAKIQLVNMPGGPGVWLAMRANVEGAVAAWDEIYVRAVGGQAQGVRA
jgi:hypothetical protein